MEESKRKYTLLDIAKKANVSKSAVSLALNNKQGISEETRQKIMNLAKEMGYKPARRKRSRSYTILFLSFIKNDRISKQYKSSSFFSVLLTSLQDECAKLNYSLFFASVNSTDFKSELERILSDHQFDGILLLGTNLTKTEIGFVVSRHNNVVVLDNSCEKINTNCVVMDNFLGAYNAADYLIKKGLTDLGYICSNSSIANFKARRKGFLDALKENDIKTDKNSFLTTNADIDAATIELISLLKKKKGRLPKAFFCECDYLAIGLIKALQRLGYSVPEDISVVGFDNVIEADFVSPRLTTIDVDKEMIAVAAIGRMSDLINRKSAARLKIIVETELLQRESSL